MKYAIPKQFLIGRKPWYVHELPATRTRYGECFPELRSISVSSKVGGVPVSVKEKADTFWHETTHAILHHMGTPLADDERFVSEFAKHLTHVIWTAEF